MSCSAPTHAWAWLIVLRIPLTLDAQLAWQCCLVLSRSGLCTGKEPANQFAEHEHKMSMIIAFDRQSETTAFLRTFSCGAADELFNPLLGASKTWGSLFQLEVFQVDSDTVWVAMGQQRPVPVGDYQPGSNGFGHYAHRSSSVVAQTSRTSFGHHIPVCIGSRTNAVPVSIITYPNGRLLPFRMRGDVTLSSVPLYKRGKGDGKQTEQVVRLTRPIASIHNNFIFGNKDDSTFSVPYLPLSGFKSAANFSSANLAII
ncbi:hypothetical protein V8B97DRAFT_1920568 [Scleroderma yunnanense]